MTKHQEEVFFELHSGNRREGPGCFESTAKAFTYLAELPDNPLILDIGCGPGAQTIDLAKISSGVIYAVDIYDSMLNILKTEVIENNLIQRIRPFKMSMDSLTFDRKFFDLIWGEGSIYIMGFESGLKYLKPFLKHKGYLAVTEISWLKSDPPKELKDFWDENYPAMKPVQRNLDIIHKCGYSLVNHFTLPESAWLDEYYSPILEKLPTLFSKYDGDEEATFILQQELTEIELYKKYSAYYGYEFYIMQKD